MTTAQQIGERLYVLMRRRGLTGVAGARHLGIAQPTMSKKLKGDRPFSLDELLRLCEWLEVGPGEVLGEIKPGAGAGPDTGGSAVTRCTLPSDAPVMSSQVSGLSMAAA